jgi:hypothetical protein
VERIVEHRPVEKQVRLTFGQPDWALKHNARMHQPSGQCQPCGACPAHPAQLAPDSPALPCAAAVCTLSCCCSTLLRPALWARGRLVLLALTSSTSRSVWWMWHSPAPPAPPTQVRSQLLLAHLTQHISALLRELPCCLPECVELPVPPAPSTVCRPLLPNSAVAPRNCPPAGAVMNEVATGMGLGHNTTTGTASDRIL